MEDAEIIGIAPCLEKGPLSQAGMDFVKTALQLPQSYSGDILKSWATYYCFLGMESAFSGDSNPTAQLIENFESQKEFLSSYQNLNQSLLHTPARHSKNRNTIADIEKETGDHYGNLFKKFDKESYFNEAAELLKTRLEVNNIFPENIQSKIVLDAGCGGGRYSAAWKKLGADKVTGVDFSEVGISSAIDRLSQTDIEVTYKVEDVLNLSFEDDLFDIVFSNGVLHHSRDLEKGVGDLVRVLKPGGFGWLYLIENPGGYFWDMIEILRVIMKDVINETAREALGILRVPANRIFYILDHIMAPINLRLTDPEISLILEKKGAKDIRRLERGCSFDRVEKIFQKEPFAELKYGVGEHRYIFTK